MTNEPEHCHPMSIVEDLGGKEVDVIVPRVENWNFREG